MEAVKTLSDTWTARNPFEEQPFGYCEVLTDLSLRERRMCFNHYLSSVPGYHKIKNQTEGISACESSGPSSMVAQVKQDQGCMAFLRRQALTQQFEACGCTMSGSCTPDQFAVCNQYREAMGKIDAMMQRQGQFGGSGSMEDIMQRQEAEANATIARQAALEDERAKEVARQRAAEAETDRMINGINDTLTAGLAKSHQEAADERSLMGWLEDALGRLGLVPRNHTVNLEDSDGGGGGNETTAAAVAAASARVAAQLAKVREMAAGYHA